MKEKETIRKQVNKLLGREVTDTEAQGIDFSGAIEELEPDLDDIMPFLAPVAIAAGGMVCILLGISIRNYLAFLGVNLGVYAVTLTLGWAFYVATLNMGWAFIQRKKRAEVRNELLEIIQKRNEKKAG